MGQIERLLQAKPSDRPTIEQVRQSPFMNPSASALIDGLHLGLLVTPRELSKRRARAVARDFLRRAFPQHIH